MNRITCSHIKRDRSACGQVCTCLAGCSLHWKSGANNMLKSPCRICDKPTLSYTRYCSKHAKKIYRHLKRETTNKFVIMMMPTYIMVVYFSKSLLIKNFSWHFFQDSPSRKFFGNFQNIEQFLPYIKLLLIMSVNEANTSELKLLR